MALDRFVTWHKERPTQRQIETALRRFVGGAATIKFSESRYHVKLPGTPTYVFASTQPQQKERWIEVYVDKDGNYVDIITRSQDEFTNALAEGFADSIARHWGATLSDGS